MARPPRLERGTPGLEGRCSIRLSYGRTPAATRPLYDGSAAGTPRAPAPHFLNGSSTRITFPSMSFALTMMSAALAVRALNGT